VKKYEDIAHVFKEYDIRGRAGTELDYDFARRLGWAFSEFISNEGSYIAVGRDNRKSSSELADGLIAGLTEGGLNVYDIGEVPTPVLYFSIIKLYVNAGIMITASHNPPEDNGFKIAVGKRTIASDEIRKLFEIFKVVESKGKSGIVERVDVVKDYKERLLEEFGYLRELPAIRVGIDAGNGIMGPLAKEVLEEVGCEVYCLYCEPDGSFPNHQPDPTVPENLKELAQKVKDNGFDLGIGFDGDGDRLGLIDENGNFLMGDKILYIFSDQILSKNPGAVIVADVKCTSCLFDFISSRGGNAILWKSGHSLVKKKIHEVGALFGGELSGHYYFLDRYYGFDDGLYAALRAVEIAKHLKKEGRGISSILRTMPELYSTKEIRMECPEKFKLEAAEEISKELKELRVEGFTQLETIEIDGIRINYDHGWVLVRPSNTQAALVVRCEADTKERLEVLKQAVEEKVFGVLQKYSSC
jgi:phosphomannomutase/phosphoglucomutase